jgi:hypothetical protein
MRPVAALAFAPLLACLALAGCGRLAPGLIIGEDGEMLSATDANIRLTTVRTIERQLDAQLGKHWRCEAAIAELPVFGPHERHAEDGWMWPKLTATVTLIGDGAGAALLTESEVSAAVVDYLAPKVERPARNLTVTVASVTDAARFAARGGATPPAPPAAPVATAPLPPPAQPAPPPAQPAPAPLPEPPAAAPPAPASSQPAAAVTVAPPAAPPRPAPAAPAPALGIPPAGERVLAPGELRYTVQAGDSLAELSVAFYGTPDHWRRIADANPGTAGGQLRPGTVIVIPAKP